MAIFSQKKSVLLLNFCRLLIAFVFYVNNTNAQVTHYYINDALQTGDTCTAAGDNTKDGKFLSTPKKTLYALFNAYGASFADGDVIHIDQGTYLSYALGDGLGASYGLSISKAIKINGAGANKTIIDNNHISISGASYLFNITAGVTVANLKIQNYGSNASAQALFINKGAATSAFTVTIKNVELTSCGGSNGYAPIYVTAGTSAVPITVNIFGGGSYCNGNSSYPASGGIDVNGDYITLNATNMVFYNNYKAPIASIASGSALAIMGGTNSNQKINVNNCIFDKNHVDNSTALNNGSILISTGSVTVSNSIIQGSKQLGSSAGGHYATAVYQTGGVATFSQTLIQQNNINGTSAIYGTYGLNGGTANITSCKFANNETSSRAIDIYTKAGTLNLNNTIFTSTITTLPKIYNNGASTSITNCGTPSYTNNSGSCTDNLGAAPSSFVNPSTPTYTGSCSLAFSILPIELIRFEGDCNNDNIILTWQTASENNNLMFFVERSFDGVNFSEIGTVKAQGTTYRKINYNYIDYDKIEGIVYYKLIQSDYNGRQSQSNVISVEHNCGEKTDLEIVIYPNPTSDNTILTLKLLTRSSIYVEVYNGIGQLIKLTPSQVYEVGLQEINMETSEFPTGLYFIKTIVNEKEYIKKIVKQ